MSDKKPEPEEAIAVEDFRNGLVAAKKAGIPCLFIPSHYNRDHDHSEAALLVSELGDTGTPIQALSNPYEIEVGKAVDVEALLRLHQAAIR